MSYLVQKKATGDLVALIGLNVIPLISILDLVGIVSVFGEKWYWYIITVLCCLISFPVWARFFSLSPLVEVNEEHVSFFVGLLRKRPVRISRVFLLDVIDDTESCNGERTNVLRLIFAHGSLQTLLESPITPYLSVFKDEVVIQSAFVDGDLTKIADALKAGTWGRKKEAQKKATPDDS